MALFGKGHRAVTCLERAEKKGVGSRRREKEREREREKEEERWFATLADAAATLCFIPKGLTDRQSGSKVTVPKLFDASSL
jgi:hypothetical protein